MRTVTKENIKKFEKYLYAEERSCSTVEKYMRDVRFFRGSELLQILLHMPQRAFFKP